MSLPLDIARSHLETLVEQITGVEKAVPDHQGDYLVTVEGADFYARVDGERWPIIRVFSVIVAGVDRSAELFEELNSINLELTFLRAVWWDRQVMIESEWPATETDTDQFLELCRRVAQASDFFGPDLVEEFGGEDRYGQSRFPDWEPQPRFPGYVGG